MIILEQILLLSGILRERVLLFPQFIPPELATSAKNWQLVPEGSADTHRLYPFSSYSAKWHRISQHQRSAFTKTFSNFALAC